MTNENLTSANAVAAEVSAKNLDKVHNLAKKISTLQKEIVLLAKLLRRCEDINYTKTAVIFSGLHKINNAIDEYNRLLDEEVYTEEVKKMIKSIPTPNKDIHIIIDADKFSLENI